MKKLPYFGILMLLTVFSAVAQIQPTEKGFSELPSDKYTFDHFSADHGAEVLGGGRIRRHNDFTWMSGFALANEIVRFDGINFKFAELYFRDSLIKASTYYYLFDHKGQLWYGARGKIYLCKNPDSWTKKAGQSGKYKLRIDSIYTEILDKNFVTNIIGEDKKGNLWIAQSSGKLFCFNPDSGKRKIFKFPEGQKVVDWLLDKQGRVWVISNKELYVFDSITQNFTPVSILNAMGVPATTELRKICSDAQSTIWIGTDRAGIFQFPFNAASMGSALSQF